MTHATISGSKGVDVIYYRVFLLTGAPPSRARVQFFRFNDKKIIRVQDFWTLIIFSSLNLKNWTLALEGGLQLKETPCITLVSPMKVF